MKKVNLANGYIYNLTDYEYQVAKVAWKNDDFFECERLGIVLNKKFIISIETPNFYFGKKYFLEKIIANKKIVFEYYYNDKTDKLLLIDNSDYIEIKDEKEKREIKKNFKTETEYYHPKKKEELKEVEHKKLNSGVQI